TSRSCRWRITAPYSCGSIDSDIRAEPQIPRSLTSVKIAHRRHRHRPCRRCKLTPAPVPGTGMAERLGGKSMNDSSDSRRRTLLDEIAGEVIETAELTGIRRLRAS